jgi:hypothetical protein
MASHLIQLLTVAVEAVGRREGAVEVAFTTIALSSATIQVQSRLQVDLVAPLLWMVLLSKFPPMVQRFLESLVGLPYHCQDLQPCKLHSNLFNRL